MSKTLLSCLVFVWLSASGQNQDQNFKMVPHLDGSEPEWVKLMYSDNPNVYEVRDRHEAFYKTHEWQKNLHTQNYKHWLQSVSGMLTQEGYILSHYAHKEELVERLKRVRAGQIREKRMDIWQCIGPWETYADDPSLGILPVSWQVNVYCIDQSVSNPDIIYAGTEGQGAWKSIDKGLNWTSITHHEDIGSVTDIKVAASDEQLVYLAATGNIFKSLDGGASWASILSPGDVYQIVVHPTSPDTVLVVGPQGLHRTYDGGQTWSNPITDKCWDINYHPTDPSIIYLLRHNSNLAYTEFWKSTDEGASFQQIASTWYDPINAAFAGHVDYGALIAVTPLEPSKVYVAMLGNHKAEDNGWIGIYRSEDAGASWVNPIQDGGPYSNPTNQNLATSGLTSGFSQYFYDFAFDASHTIAGKLYLGVLALSVSDDSGSSWKRIGSYSVPAAYNVGWIHPDIQDIHVLGSDVWMACDGGINYSQDEFVTHESRKKGLAGSHFWGLAQGWNEDILVGGRYHNGNTALYEEYSTGNSSRLGGGEAPTGYVDLLDPFTTYFSDISTKILDPAIVGKHVSRAKLSKYPHESYFHADNSEIVRDPRYVHHLYIGANADDGNGGFWKSTDNGQSFHLLHYFGSGKVTGIEISRNDPRTLYCVYNRNTIHKSTDGGHTWQEITALPAVGSMMISINPDNDQELWVFIYTNDNTNKVFRTADGGKSWENKTTATLSGHRINDGFFQGGSIHGRAYVVSAYGLYYWDADQGDWVDYHLGLPFRMSDVKHVLQPFYRDSKIRLSSVRGIWEAALQENSIPLAHPMTATDTIFCSRDTIQMDCHSILDHDGATWQWVISPEPLWMSSTTVRNPRILLADGTTYDVALTVTNGQGLSDTECIGGMITVASQCEVESWPGQAIAFDADGDWVQVNDLDLVSNRVSISAWVKPNGIQPQYSGIVMNDGTSAGFNFREDNNTLAYHWPGGAWWWDSGLEIPAEEWSHVAMVVSPTSMTVYVNGEGATHATSAPSMKFSTP